MSTDIAKSGGVYGDFAGLEKLKSAVRQQDPSALRQVAQQFESLFARMMLKSMRKAIGKDPVFGSDQSQMYQGMFDDQLSLELTRGRGLGLADMLMRQLRGAASAPATRPSATGNTPAARAATPTASAVTPASGAERAQFVRTLWPQAQAAAQQLGVHPLGLVAQAALESNWGRALPRGSGGQTSNNLFGIKATNAWNGDSVTAATHEFQGGAAAHVRDAFRAYPSTQAALQDYVATLRGNPRYSAALGSGNDVGAFAAALQKGGYATDPDYARKVTGVAQQVAALLGGCPPGETQVKFADTRPITPGTTAL